VSPAPPEADDADADAAAATAADDEAELGHRNLIAYSRATAGWGATGRVRDEGGVLLYAGGSWLPVGGNGAFRTDDAVAGAELVARADAFFARLGRGYSIRVRDTGQDADIATACQAAGVMPFGEPVPQMICRHRLDDPTPPPGVSLRAVTDEAGVRDFVSVNTDAYSTYGMPTDVLADMFSRPDEVVARPDTVIGVAYKDGRPVATALSFVSEGSAALQWVGTVADARQLRLGRLVTQWATNVAFDMGAPSCTLQASPMGEPLYAKLGYETIYHYVEHVRWSTPTQTKTPTPTSPSPPTA
jgi:hypothetical protein